MGYRAVRHLLLASLALTCTVSFAQSVIERAKKDELVFMRDEEPAMRRAFQVARETLDTFLETAERGASNHTGFAVKVAISQGDETEYFWVNNFESKARGQFEGEINNEPRMVKSVRLGQRYAFSREQVVDWMYLDRSERRMVGNFTLCALLTQQSRREAEATIRRFKLDCSRVIE
jgi:uncharacterized protein YegJ (DUF2314 family)